MDGGTKMRAALSKEGSTHTPAVICYEGIFIRDHWAQLTDSPWWHMYETDIEKQAKWREDAVRAAGYEWFLLPKCASRTDRAHKSISVEPDGVYQTDGRSPDKRKLEEPVVSGNTIQIWHRDIKAETPDDIDALIPAPAGDAGSLINDGGGDLAERLLTGFCGQMCPIAHVNSPFAGCVSLWGFEGFMLKLYDDPGLVKRARDRYFLWCEAQIKEAAALGVEVIWIEECYVDMVGPEQFRTFNYNCLNELTGLIRAAGMQSVYYPCGDPWNKMDQYLSVGADAVSFEESKKGFEIDIEDVVDAVNGKCAVLGNLDAIWLLPYCTEDELKTEINRQLKAGRRNGGRFIMSMGSPVTPGTSVKRVKLYCDLVRGLTE